MEVVFIVILLLTMMVALSSGFPVAFSLPGAAVLSIGLAALCGYLFTGDSSAFFVEGGPVEWLSAGVTNFRSLYWDVERDTLIAVPLFIFMGIMLQRSKIAEDLLVAMAQLFGPVPCTACGYHRYRWGNGRCHGIDFTSGDVAKQLFQTVGNGHNLRLGHSRADHSPLYCADYPCGPVNRCFRSSQYDPQSIL
jgi:hypothetical protein